MARHNELGRKGEEQALAYLRSKGYKIRHRNWRFMRLELDIVAEYEGVLVVFEVKTRSTKYFEHPQEAITNRKIKNIVEASHEYIIECNWQGETRFDVISVMPDAAGGFEIEHLEDAFLAP